MLTFICYPKCTTCQKAKKWLDDNHITYEIRDIKTDRTTIEELTSWHKMSGLELKKFFNTSGLLYKSMDLKNKLAEMDESAMLELLATDGMLVKRPLLVGDELILTGFKEAEWSVKVKPARVITYHKLVRDRIPDIIREAGKNCKVRILDEEEYLQMIDAKLDEELAEYHKDQNIEELADLMEVIYAAARARGYSVEQLEQVRASKAAKRGSFEKRLLLLEVEETD